jgi:hypothetical protein
MKEVRPRLSGQKLSAYNNLIKEENRVLFIGDLHEPFTLSNYLQFNIDTYNKYNCNKVIFAGDVIDSHYTSYHETDPDGMGGGDELDLAISKLKKWHDAFPDADVMIGNHDRIVYRQAFSAGIPKRWLKPFEEVLEVPGWRFKECMELDNVLYEHGEGGQAFTKAKNNMMSSACGHVHTEAYVRWLVGMNFKVFALQSGSGLDWEAYAAAYAKKFKKQAIGSAVIIGGHTAFNVLMDL